MGGAYWRSCSEIAEDWALEPGSSGALQGGCRLDLLLPGPRLAWKLGSGYIGAPLGNTRSRGERADPGLVSIEVGSLGADLWGRQKAGMGCLVMPPPSRCHGPAVHRLPSSWELSHTQWVQRRGLLYVVISSVLLALKG